MYSSTWALPRHTAGTELQTPSKGIGPGTVAPSPTQASLVQQQRSPRTRKRGTMRRRRRT